RAPGAGPGAPGRVGRPQRDLPPVVADAIRKAAVAPGPPHAAQVVAAALDARGSAMAAEQRDAKPNQCAPPSHRTGASARSAFFLPGLPPPPGGFAATAGALSSVIR